MKNSLLIIALVLVIGIQFGCSKQIVYSSGSSFGLCTKNCNKELSVYKDKHTYAVWNNGKNSPKNEMMVRTESLYFDRISALLNKIDFKKLDLRYGCPDCADGGAEWIEVKIGMNTKRVVFEYNNPPSELAALHAELKLVRQLYEAKR